MRNFQNLTGSSRTDYCYRVYKKICEQNPDVTMTPFRHGLSRAMFAVERVTLNSQNGGMYQGPTIEALISKILKAESMV